MTEDEKQNLKELREKRALLFVDRLLDSFDTVVAKLTSGKFLAVTFDTVGYLAGVVLSGYLAVKKLIEPATFIAILSTYALLVQKTRESYFGINRDRTETDKPIGGIDEKKTISSVSTITNSAEPVKSGIINPA